MIENLEYQTSVGDPSNDGSIEKTLVGVFCILFFFVCCCVCGKRVSDEDQQDRQVESNNNSNPTITGDDRHDSAAPSSLPVFVYSSTANEANLECSLCLTEFKDGEVGRFLPRCCHGFHKDCVDVWLNSHSTCPLCRSKVEFGTPDFNV